MRKFIKIPIKNTRVLIIAAAVAAGVIIKRTSKERVESKWNMNSQFKQRVFKCFTSVHQILRMTVIRLMGWTALLLRSCWRMTPPSFVAVMTTTVVLMVVDADKHFEDYYYFHCEPRHHLRHFIQYILRWTGDDNVMSFFIIEFANI